MRFFVTLFTILLSLPIYSSAQEVAEIPWRSMPDFQCSQDQEACFGQASDLIKRSFLPFEPSHSELHNFHFDSGSKKDAKGVTRYALTSKKTEHAYVLIHGLYGDDAQFRSLAFYLNSRQQNVLHLVLPGHGTDWRRAPKINPQEWRQEVSKALKLAQHLGEKTIVLGQSTGGLLALMASFNEPELIDGLILMEPALVVKQDMASLACSTKYFVAYAHEATTIAKMVGFELKNIPKSVSPHMGCEVANMRAPLLRDLNLPSDSTPIQFSDGAQPTELETIENSRRLAELVRVPTLVFNAPDDKIVKSEDIKAFADTLEAKGLGIYFEYKPGIGHGIYNHYASSQFYQQIDRYLSKFHNLDKITANIAFARDEKLRLERKQLSDKLDEINRHYEVVKKKRMALFITEMYSNMSKLTEKYKVHPAVYNEASFSNNLQSFFNDFYGIERRMLAGLMYDRKFFDNLNEINSLLSPSAQADLKLVNNQLHVRIHKIYALSGSKSFTAKEFFRLLSEIRQQLNRSDIQRAIINLDKELRT